MNCQELPTQKFSCEDQILSDNFHNNQTPREQYPGQSGQSGKTGFHQKLNSSKKPKGKFTSIKNKP